jgi:UDP-glucuronate 4-epimerase
MMEGEPIDVYNHGDMYRDFTYINDIVEAVTRLVDHPPGHNRQWNAEDPDPATSRAPYRIYNVGNNEPVKLMKFIEVLEEKLGREARKNYEPMRPEEVYKTWSDCTDLYDTISFAPETPLEEGIEQFVAWYRAYYEI